MTKEQLLEIKKINQNIIDGILEKESIYDSEVIRLNNSTELILRIDNELTNRDS